MAPPLFYFGCILINRNKQTSFFKFIALVYKQQSKKTEVEKHIHIRGKLLSICHLIGGLTLNKFLNWTEKNLSVWGLVLVCRVQQQYHSFPTISLLLVGLSKSTKKPYLFKCGRATIKKMVAFYNRPEKVRKVVERPFFDYTTKPVPNPTSNKLMVGKEWYCCCSCLRSYFNVNLEKRVVLS